MVIMALTLMLYCGRRILCIQGGRRAIAGALEAVWNDLRLLVTKDLYYMLTNV